MNRILKYRKLVVTIRNEACMYKYLYAKSFKYSKNKREREIIFNFSQFIWVVSSVF